MLYHTDTGGSARFHFPNSFGPKVLEGAGSVLLELLSNVDRETVVQPVTVEDVSALYISGTVVLPELTPGEWAYKLIAGGRTITTGLLIVTGDGVSRRSYNQTITYEQYT